MTPLKTLINLSNDSETILNKPDLKKEIIKELFNRSLNQIQNIRQEFGQNLIKKSPTNSDE